MELSKNIADGISAASNESTISDAVYSSILNDIFQTASGNNGSKINLGECDHKIVYSSFLSLLLEAAKHDAHASTLSALLEECQIGSQRITKFLNMYQENKEKIQLQLSFFVAPHSRRTVFNGNYRMNSNAASEHGKHGFDVHWDYVPGSTFDLIGKSHNQIVNASWRQDYIIKSSNCEKICEPSYLISLKTWNTQNNSEDDITFGCSMEQLQDLVLKLKDATKCIERNAA